MKKIAILFGNDSYQEKPLLNAKNDAINLSEKLEELGFKCITLLDSKAEEMHREINSLKEILDEYEVGLFFFAGHGAQIDGINYLAAVDTGWYDGSAYKYTSIALNYIIEIFEKSKLITKIIILDACRDNPFEGRLRGSSGIGLAPVYAPKGTIISYATSPGQVARDGTRENGAFTSSLLAHIGTQGIGIEEFFRRVRNTLSSITDNKQISWEHTSLMGNFWFNPGFLDGQFTTIYSKEALSDRDYTFDSESDLSIIIEDLKSHNWYIQNPAIGRIESIEFPNSSKDELFLLGRNIYQAACGSSQSAVEWIHELETNLSELEPEVSFHILNGIFYEVYFDSRGKLRKQFKARCFNPVIKLANKPKYEKSCMFIRKQLEQHTQRIIYIPGSEQVICLDIIVNTNSEDEYYVDKICIEGQNIFYNEDGIGLYEYSSNDWDIRQLSLEKFEDVIRELLIVPKRNININYINNETNTHLLIPYQFMLLRFSI